MGYYKYFMYMAVLMFSGFLLFSEAEVITTGPILFIQPEQSYRVVLDGEELGQTPLLISDLNSSAGVLQLFGDNEYAELQILFYDKIKTATVIHPKGVPYFGYLELGGINKDSTVFMDNEAKVFSLDSPLILPIGNHLIRIEQEGYFSQEFSVEIEKLLTARLDVNLQRACRVSLNIPLPLGTLLHFSHVDYIKTWEYQGEENVTLFPGTWQVIIESPFFEKIQKEIILTEENNHTILALEPNFYSPSIILTGIIENSIIRINDEEKTTEENTLKLMVEPGTSLLLVESPGYLTIDQEVTLSGNEILELDLSYIKDPHLLKKGRTQTGWILLGSGLSMLAGGYILNNDNILVSASQDFDQYSVLKYTTLGIAGSGLLTLLTGSGFLLSTLGLDS